MSGHPAEREDLSVSPDSPPAGPRRASTGGIAAEKLHSLVERIERREARKAEIDAVLADLYAEAEAAGITAETVRQIIARRAAHKNSPTNRRT